MREFLGQVDHAAACHSPESTKEHLDLSKVPKQSLCDGYASHAQPKPQSSKSYPSTVDSRRLRKCQEVLLHAFRKCSENESRDLACIISCTLNVSRHLTTAEIRDAVFMHSYAQRSRRPWMGRSTPDFRAWLISFGTLFVVNHAENVSFGMTEMPYFLRGVRIRGIDASHRTIAQICLTFMELSNRSQGDKPQSAFSSYAMHNWQYHQHVAARSSLSLRHESMTRRRTRSGGTRSAACDSRRRSPSPLGVVQLEFEDLNVKDEVEDWVLIEKQ